MAKVTALSSWLHTITISETRPFLGYLKMVKEKCFIPMKYIFIAIDNSLALPCWKLARTINIDLFAQHQQFAVCSQYAICIIFLF